MTHYFYNIMSPWFFIFLGLILVLAAMDLWIYSKARKYRIWMDEQTLKMIAMVKERENIEDKVFDFAEKLADKDRIIDSVLKESNAARALWLQDEKGLVDDIDRLKEILSRVHPYSRLYLNDPAKLDAWLTRLKAPKKGKQKAKI